MIAGLIVRGVLWLARHDVVPVVLRGHATYVTLGLILVYNRVLPARFNRTCMFHPSCSMRSAEAFRAFGWSDGLAFTAQQLRRCDGEFSLLTTADGEVVLITSDGTHFVGAELSPMLRECQ